MTQRRFIMTKGEYVKRCLPVRGGEEWCCPLCDYVGSMPLRHWRDVHQG